MEPTGACEGIATKHRRGSGDRLHRPESLWEVALEHYQWDRVLEALDLVEDQGIGETGRLLSLYRLIEAEAITRRKGAVRQVAPWLSIEYVPDDLMGWEDVLAPRILAACDEIADRLGWRHEQPTRIALLAEETDADWATYPYGYCADKEPYEKICLPNYLLDDPEEFHRALSHEYAHVISGGLSDGQAPRWLEEAVSMLAEGSTDPDLTLELRIGEAPWLSANELESVLESRGDDPGDVKTVLRAYQQVGWIGRYLHAIGGDRKLREMLVALADDSVKTNLKLRLLGRDRVDAAVRAVYGQRLSRVFDHALTLLVHSEPAE